MDWDIIYPDGLINREINNKREEDFLIWRLGNRVDQTIIPISTIVRFPALSPKLKTLECDILNPDGLINLGINNKS